MKTNLIKYSVLFLVVFLLSIGSTALALDQTPANLIQNYKKALATNDPAAIRKAYEALKANTEAVTYMSKNHPNLYERYKQSKASAASGQARIAEQAKAKPAQAASGQTVNTGERLKTKIKGPSAQSTNPGGQLEAMGIPDNRPPLTPEQAGVTMPRGGAPLSPEELNRTKWVEDPDLARLSNPRGQDLGKAPEGHKGIGDHARGAGGVIDSGKMKTGQVPPPGAGRAEMVGQAKVPSVSNKSGLSGPPKQNFSAQPPGTSLESEGLSKIEKRMQEDSQFRKDMEKIREQKRVRAQETPEAARQRRTQAAQERINQRHPHLGADDELAKAVEAVRIEAEGGPKATERQKALNIKQNEYVESRRFAGGREVVPDKDWRAHKDFADRTIQEAQGEAARGRGAVPGKQAASLPEGELPKPKGDHDLYFDSKDPKQRYGGDPDRLTSELQEQLQQDTRKNLNKTVEKGGLEPMTQEEFTKKKIDNLPADVEKVGKRGTAQEFQDLAEKANKKQMEMYTDKKAVEAEQKLRGMKEGRVDLETQGRYGAEQQRQADHHKKLGDKHREKFVKGKKTPVGPHAADEQLFNATEVDAEGSKVAKHLDREHGARKRAAADIEAEFGKKIKVPKPEISKELSESIQSAKKRLSAAGVEYDAARVASMKDHIAAQDALATADMHANAANKVPELKAEAQRGTAARSQPLNASQRGDMLEKARAVGGEQYAEGVRKEMIEMDKKNKASGPQKHRPKVDPKAAAEARAGVRGKSSSIYVESATQEKATAEGATGALSKAAAETRPGLRGKSSSIYIESAAQEKAAAEGATGALSKAAGKAADAMRKKGVRVPTQGQVMTGLGKGMDAVMIAGMAGHGIQKERQEAAEEGRDFSTVRATINATVRDPYEGAKHVATEEVMESDRRGESRGSAAVRVAARTGDGLSGLSVKQGKFQEEALEQNRRVREEGRNWDWTDSADYRARATARSMPLHDMTEDLIKEEMQREVNEHGADASPGWAKARAAARVPFEALHAGSVFEAPYEDTEAHRRAGETGRRVQGRRQDAILDMDDGLHEIASIQQRLRDLDKNPNQDDPWVKQRRQELLDAYTAKRSELQGTNEALGAEAGAGDGEYIAIRGAVALIPEKPDYRRDEGEQIEEVADAVFRDPDMEGETEEVADAILRDPAGEIDDLAKAMVDNQVTAEERAQWQDQEAADPNGLAGEAVRGFTGTNAAGFTDTERDMHASARVTRTPDKVKKKDVEEERRKAEEQERQADERRANQQRLDEAQFTNDWSSTISDINDSLSELNEQDAKKVKDMTEAAIKLIKQMQNGTLSDEDFTSQMAALENEHANLQREGLEGWQRIRDRLIGDQVNPDGGRADRQIGGDEADPCVNNFTMTNNYELRCKCQGYTFDNSKARCVKTGGGAGTASAGGTGGAASTGNICPCVDEEGRRYRTPFGQPCSFDLGFIDRDYNCSDDTGGARNAGSATGTGGSGGGATGRKGMMYRVHTPPYGGGDVCLTSEEAAGIRNAPNTVLFESLGEPCFK